MRSFQHFRIFTQKNAQTYRDLFILVGLFLASFFFWGLGIILFEIRSVNFSKNLIIHFDFFQGITFLGDIGWVHRIMFLSGLIELLNFSLAWFFIRRQVFISYIFAGASVLFSLLIFSALLVIIANN